MISIFWKACYEKQPHSSIYFDTQSLQWDMNALSSHFLPFEDLRMNVCSQEGVLRICFCSHYACIYSFQFCHKNSCFLRETGNWKYCSRRRSNSKMYPEKDGSFRSKLMRHSRKIIKHPLSLTSHYECAA